MAEGLPAATVRPLLQDQEGGLWLAMPGAGVARFDGARFTVFTQADGLPSDQIRSLAEDGQGNLWFAADPAFGRGLTCLDRVKGEFIAYDGDDGPGLDCARNLAVDAGTNLWFTGNMSVGRWDPDHGQFVRYTCQDGGCGRLFGPIHRGKSGRLWVGPFGSNELCEWQGERFVVHRTPVPLHICDVLLADNQGGVWVAGNVLDGNEPDGGGSPFWRYEPATGRWGRFAGNQGFGSGAATVMLEDRQGHIWLGGTTGLVQFRDGRFERVNREAERWGITGFIGRSPMLKRILEDVRRLQAHGAASVLITGESGTGKELIARAIHFGGTRAEGPFIPINCPAIPAELAEATLFGHQRGAFTGAHAERKGCFELADGGTLFLDEISELPPALQPKLLRVLDDGIVVPLGAAEGRRVEVSVAACSEPTCTTRGTCCTSCTGPAGSSRSMAVAGRNTGCAKGSVNSIDNSRAAGHVQHGVTCERNVPWRGRLRLDRRRRESDLLNLAFGGATEASLSRADPRRAGGCTRATTRQQVWCRSRWSRCQRSRRWSRTSCGPRSAARRAINTIDRPLVVQVRGPYRRWHHTHTFEARDGGTHCSDRVRYWPRGGIFLNRLFVRRDVERIFAFRRRRMQELFGGGPPLPSPWNPSNPDLVAIKSSLARPRSRVSRSPSSQAREPKDEEGMRRRGCMAARRSEAHLASHSAPKSCSGDTRLWLQPLPPDVDVLGQVCAQSKLNAP